MMHKLVYWNRQKSWCSRKTDISARRFVSFIEWFNSGPTNHNHQLSSDICNYSIRFRESVIGFAANTFSLSNDFSKHKIILASSLCNFLFFCVQQDYWEKTFFCIFPECGCCPQSSNGQHATKWWHAGRTHAPRFLSSKGLLNSPPPSPPTITNPPPHLAYAKPILLSPPPFLASLAVLIPVQMCSLPPSHMSTCCWVVNPRYSDALFSIKFATLCFIFYKDKTL